MTEKDKAAWAWDGATDEIRCMAAFGCKIKDLPDWVRADFLQACIDLNEANYIFNNRMRLIQQAMNQRPSQN